jgi:hypothetical protein
VLREWIENIFAGVGKMQALIIDDGRGPVLLLYYYHTYVVHALYAIAIDSRTIMTL